MNKSLKALLALGSCCILLPFLSSTLPFTTFDLDAPLVNLDFWSRIPFALLVLAPVSSFGCLLVVASSANKVNTLKHQSKLLQNDYNLEYVSHISKVL